MRPAILLAIALVLTWWLTTDSVWPHVVQALGYVWGHGGA